MKKPYSNFDLPRQHIYGNHYYPARARRIEEIERRRVLPTGTILAEQQRDGLAIGTAMLAGAEELEDQLYITDILAASGLNSAWYSYARDAAVMRRRQLLPELANDEGEEDWRQTRRGLLTKAQTGLVVAAELAASLAQARAVRRERQRQSVELGRHMGNVSLELACVKLGSAPRGISAFEIQSIAREQALEALEHSRVIAGRIGVHPSIAQLADRDSPLAVDIRRYAPNGACEAFERATEELGRVA